MQSKQFSENIYNLIESAHKILNFKPLDLIQGIILLNTLKVSTYSCYHHTLKLQTDKNLRHIMPAALSTAFLTYALLYSMSF